MSGFLQPAADFVCKISQVDIFCLFSFHMILSLFRRHGAHWRLLNAGLLDNGVPSMSAIAPAFLQQSWLRYCVMKLISPG